MREDLQVDEGVWERLDDVVVEVEALHGAERRHLQGTLRQPVLGQVCKGGGDWLIH